MFKPYGLTYTLVWFVILSNIPSGKKLRGLSKMVLKNKISTHYTSDDLIDIVKAPNITDRFFILKYVCCFLLTSSRPKKKENVQFMKFISFSELQSKSVHLSVYSQLLQYKSVKSLAFNSFDCVTVKKPAEKKYVSVIFYSQSNCF